MALSRSQAAGILNDVETGVAPKDYVRELSPRSNPLFDRVIRKDLDLLGAPDTAFSRVRFLKGSYGEGKTHFLSDLKERALEQGFVVTMFPISSRGISFDMFERALAEMVKTLAVSSKREGTVRESVLDSIIKRWSEALQKPEDAFLDSPEYDKDARQAVCMLAQFLRHPDQHREDISKLNDWFLAKAMPVGMLKSSYTVHNQLSARNALWVLKFLAHFFVLAGYRGWVVLIDEQEIVSTLLAPRRRKLTDENLRVLIDAQGDIQKTYFLFATTSEFFTDPERGVNSYPALRSRVTGTNTYDLPSLSKAQMAEVGHNLKAIFDVAEGTTLAMTDQLVETFAEVADGRLEGRSARARVFVRSFVRALRMVQERKKVTLETFAEIVDGVYNEVTADRESALEELLDRD